VNIFIIFTFLAAPFQWVLERLTSAFSDVGPLNAIGAFGLSVIVLTIALRAVLFPVFNWQLRTSRRIQAEQRMIAPQLQELRKKFKKEPQKLSAEMNKLYREHGISPFSGLTGCLPALVQMPVLLGLYNAIRNATTHLGAEHFSLGFLWIPNVSKSVQESCCVGGNWLNMFSMPQLLILPLIAAAFTFAQSRMMMPPPRPDMTSQERSMANVTKQMSFLFPVMVFVFGILLPQGLAIYWVTGNIFMVMQQFYVVGWGGLKVPAWWPGANRVTPLSYPKAQPAAALTSANGSKKAARNATARGGGAAEPAEDEEAAAATPVKTTRSMVRTGARPSQRVRRRRRR
jgi:YidC/Oxa1 family membrane protein insertase